MPPKIPFIFVILLTSVASECPNACSGRGDCGSYDQCTCYRNWQGADCSQRTCPFGLAHVDSPKGDLDGSTGKLSGPKKTLIVGSTVYPFGTQEQFPNMSNSNGQILSNTAHYYMECSNKGMCDRIAGTCECFQGYDGSACQRASCPNDCSGHGTCESIEDLAFLNGNNEYNLWDAKITMGCTCDPGYSGADCSIAMCKYGVDPLYIGHDATARVESVTYRLSVNSTLGGLFGMYSLKFFDSMGGSYRTSELFVDATCSDVQNALERLPNKVIPTKSVLCTSNYTITSSGELSTVEYSLTFTGNPGYLKQLEVDTYLDGLRPTVYASQSSELDLQSAHVSIFNTGITGEFTDHFATQCKNVYVEVTAEVAGSGILLQTSPGVYNFPELNSGFYLNLDAIETKVIKQCLGDSDGNPEDNVDVFDWDHGSIPSLRGQHYTMMSSFPHAVKLVEKNPTSNYVGGMYYLTWWEPSTKKFILANFPSERMIGKSFAVFATNAIVERVILDRFLGLSKTVDDDEYPGIYWGVGGINPGGVENFSGRNLKKEIEPRVTAFFTSASNVLFTSFDTSCVSAPAFITPCLQIGDKLFIVNSNYLTKSYDPSFDSGAAEPAVYGSTTDYESGNLYTITKIYSAPPTATTFEREDRFRIVVDKNIPFAGTSTTEDFKSLYTNTTLVPSATVGIVDLFKFTPASNGNYDFVSHCSNRGACSEGQCACFKGYTNDICNIQTALA